MVMRRMSKSLLVSGLLWLCVAGCNPVLRGNGMPREQQFPLEGFTAVSVGPEVELVLAEGPYSVRLSGDENIVALMTVGLEEGRLVASLGSRVRPQPRAVLTVTAPQITSVVASHACKVTGRVAPTARLELDMSHAVSLSLEGLQVDELIYSGRSGVDTSLSGRARRAELELLSGSNLSARGLEVEELQVQARDGVTASVRATRSISGQIELRTEMDVYGSPGARSITASSDSSITYKD